MNHVSNLPRIKAFCQINVNKFIDKFDRKFDDKFEIEMPIVYVSYYSYM